MLCALDESGRKLREARVEAMRRAGLRNFLLAWMDPVKR